MRIKIVLFALPLLAVLSAGGSPRADDKKAKGPMLVHNVFFSLKDRTAAGKEKFTQACKKHLTKHDGEVFFSAGPLAEDLKRDLNDVEFDVALTIVFEDKAAHDKYQDHPRHQAFIKENRELWKKVRVFDNYAAR